MFSSIVPESNYITDLRGSVKVYSPHNFVACISDTQCTPDIHNPPYVELTPSVESSEYYLGFGGSSDAYMYIKVYSLKGASVFKIDDAWLLIGVYTTPDGKKVLLYKIGRPVDVPAVDKVWVVKKDGTVLYGEAPQSENDLVKIGTVDDIFFIIYSDDPRIPPLAFKPKINPLLIIAGIVLGATAIVAVKDYFVETHKASREAEVQKYAVEKKYEFMDKVTEIVKDNPELADIFAGVVEGSYSSEIITWQVPRYINPHETTSEDTSPWDAFIDWLKSNWWKIVLPFMGLILLIFKWRMILDFIRDIIEWFRGRR